VSQKVGLAGDRKLTVSNAWAAGPRPSKQFFFAKKNQKTLGHLEQSAFSYGLGAGGVGFG
jgi:hypothetical protein